MTYQGNELMHALMDDALRKAEQDRLAQVALTAHPQGVRVDLGRALVRLGHWLEGRRLDDDSSEKDRDWRSN